MAASKSRLLWHQLPASVQAEIGHLAGGPIVAAQNCPGGFSPGLASRVRLDDGRRLFIKAMDANAWPGEAATYRNEAAITAALPATVPAPRLHGSLDDGRWIVLVFEDIDGHEPSQPWTAAELRRVVTALEQMSRALTPSPVEAPIEHPRLGGWTELASDAGCMAKLASLSPWAVKNLDRLIELEHRGLAAAATGNTLLHSDAYAHNILLTTERVVFVDWPHARIGNPLVDLVLLLSSAAADGIDPEPFLAAAAPAAAEPEHAPAHPLPAGGPAAAEPEQAPVNPLLAAGPAAAEPEQAPADPGPEQALVDAILAANAGFLLPGGLSEPWPGLEAITTMKLHLGTGALGWLHHRLQAAAEGRLS